jgi:hypothetical protein
VDDWEQHFVEKSRRRFEKERIEQRRQRAGAVFAAVLIGTVIAVGIVALAVFR